ncbi:MAG TPA: ACP S-malonyltransferase [Planctomycetota bacterium]|nr:ACP S-malonyltransferase [Planctomycetota bacterium]
MNRALVFPGQGAQYVGMAADLAAAFPTCRAALDEADAALGMKLSAIMAQGPEAELTRTDISQPAILVASIMALRAYAAVAGREPAFAAAAGLSLGEYTALVAAGALAFADAVVLVRLRGEAMQEAAERVKSGMVALIGADEASAGRLCAAVAQGEVLQVANLNATGQVVISGAAAACERAVAAAKEHGIKRAIPLQVAGAFHSALMAPAADRLRAALARARLADPRVPVYSNVTAMPVTRASEIPDLLVKQLTEPVRWADSVVRMQKDGIGEFLELGPGKTLCGMITRTISGATLRNLDKAADAQAFAAG